MANRKVDILVYSGIGSTTESVRHCLYSLRRLLSTNYAIIPVSERTILNEPWTKSCALLVFPGGADTGYCKSLNGDGNRLIDQYVRRGGAYLGLCAGGYFGSSRCEFEVGNKSLEVVGSRELSFFPGICRGCAFKGFKYHSEAGAKAIEVIIPKQLLQTNVTPCKFKCYYNGGGVFVDAAKYSGKGVEILARYSHPLDIDGGDGDAAVVYCKVNEGRVILSGPHPEFAAADLDVQTKIPGYLELIRVLEENELLRLSFLKACLTKLGLNISHEELPESSPSRLHLSSLQYDLVAMLVSSWRPIITTNDDGEEFIKAENDIFHLETPDSICKFKATNQYPRLSEHTGNVIRGLNATHLTNLASTDNTDQPDCDSTVKNLALHSMRWPDTEETRYFNHNAFYTNLKAYQEEKGSEAEEFGKYLLYGEVVTSTNTMLEKNPKLLSRLPTGFTFTATSQLAGRGRGSNPWVSPAGCLIMSVCIKQQISLSTTAPVVFVQYLAGIAIIQGIHTYEKGFENIPVRLKWPNDIYIKDPSKSSIRDDMSDFDNSIDDLKSYIKIGGILVNSSYSSDTFDLIVGIGLNTTNDAPTTSLNTYLKTTLHTTETSPSHFVQEKLLARILTCFETLYKKFRRTGFDASFQTLYYKYWLHTDQIVTLESEGGMQARVKGITPDWGLLEVEELEGDGRLGSRSTGKLWKLQSDYNSFDFLKGLLKTKN